MLLRQDYVVPGILLLIIMSLNNSIQQLLTETSTTAQPERNLDPTENSSSEVEQTLGLHPEVHGLWWCIVWIQLGIEMLIYTLVTAEAYSTVLFKNYYDVKIIFLQQDDITNSGSDGMEISSK